jgi:hypothetical protein
MTLIGDRSEHIPCDCIVDQMESERSIRHPDPSSGVVVVATAAMNIGRDLYTCIDRVRSERSQCVDIPQKYV